LFELRFRWMTTRWKGNFIKFSIELYFDICSVLDRGEIYEKETVRRWWEKRKRRWWWQHWREGRPMTPLSIQDQIEGFMSIDNSRQKQKPHWYMEMSGEDNEELQRMATPPWTFSFPNINACKYAFNLIRCNILFFSSKNNMTTRRTT
jgi:hypothetical protein